MILIGRFNSPFVRRVGITLRLYGIEHEHQALPAASEEVRKADLVYERGQGVSRNYKTALTWYRLAAEQGYARAQFNLGWMYRKEKGVPQDDKTAVMWYRLAAEQGYLKAMFNLGVMYFTGQGVGKDIVHAYMWANLAASRGNKYGGEVQHHVAKLMTPTDIFAAEKLARECVRKKYKGC